MSRILRELRPKSDKTDNRILYELTGIKLNQEDFDDESTPEEDLERLLDNLVGYDDLDEIREAMANESEPVTKDKSLLDE